MGEMATCAIDEEQQYLPDTLCCRNTFGALAQRAEPTTQKPAEPDLIEVACEQRQTGSTRQFVSGHLNPCDTWMIFQ